MLHVRRSQQTRGFVEDGVKELLSGFVLMNFETREINQVPTGGSRFQKDSGRKILQIVFVALV